VDWRGGLMDAEADLDDDEDEDNDDDARFSGGFNGRSRRAYAEDDDDEPAAEFWPNPEEFKGMLLDESKMRIDIVGRSLSWSLI
jgi:hypothetical protein